jgi:hypothetical protein
LIMQLYVWTGYLILENIGMIPSAFVYFHWTCYLYHSHFIHTPQSMWLKPILQETLIHMFL